MTGRVTMLGISRWGDDGTSYRTIQRFFATPLPWHLIFWHVFSAHHFQPNHVYILAGDEVVITKAGKKTFGLDRFFSGILQRVVPSVAFFSFALVSTTSRRAFPLCLEQVVRTEAEKAAAKVKAAKTAKQTSPKPKAGRPKGSKNKPKTDTHSLSCELQRIQCILQDQLALIVGTVPLTYLALDGHFGTAPAIQMVRGCGLHLISKLRSNAALFLPYDGPYQGRGPHRKYGEKLDIKALPARFLRERHVEDGVETCIYQVEALQKEVSQPLNVVVVVKLNLKTQKRAHVVLFSSDVTLSVEKVIEYYSLRFQIEIVFTQMTKRSGFACWPCRQHVADLDLPITHDHSIDEQLYQLSALGKRQVLQTWLDASAKALEPLRCCHHIHLLLRLRLQVAQLLPQSTLCLLHLLTFPFKFLPANNLRQVDFQQPRLLPVELSERFVHRPPPCLECLR
jgi:hypothetical protein